MEAYCFRWRRPIVLGQNSSLVNKGSKQILLISRASEQGNSNYASYYSFTLLEQMHWMEGCICIYFYMWHLRGKIKCEDFLQVWFMFLVDTQKCKWYRCPVKPYGQRNVKHITHTTRNTNVKQSPNTRPHIPYSGFADNMLHIHIFKPGKHWPGKQITTYKGWVCHVVFELLHISWIELGKQLKFSSSLSIFFSTFS